MPRKKNNSSIRPISKHALLLHENSKIQSTHDFTWDTTKSTESAINGSWGPSRIPVKTYRFRRNDGVQLTLHNLHMNQSIFNVIHADYNHISQHQEFSTQYPLAEVKWKTHNVEKNVRNAVQHLEMQNEKILRGEKRGQNEHLQNK